jgi:hypothetical protein
MVSATLRVSALIRVSGINFRYKTLSDAPSDTGIEKNAQKTRGTELNRYLVNNLTFKSE